jgi:oxygen-independent coproporphyrinogen-3 oxidase
MNTESNVAKFIKKYDISGPRYTSYPPAPIFSANFGPKEYEEAITRTERTTPSSEISLYLHVPFCDTLCYFCGCNTIVTRNVVHFEEYIHHLKKEIDYLSRLVRKDRRVVQMHWGGGTPTYLSPSHIEGVAEFIHRGFQFDLSAEVSVEIDPRDLSYHHLRTLRSAGFNRVSIGVQDFNPRVQLAVNRNQSEFVTRQAIDWSRELGFSGINIDLIYGLPLQTVESFGDTLEKIIGCSPNRIAVYNFAYVPWMKKHQRLIHAEDLPSPETKMQILLRTIEQLTDAGYEYIGMDHFARPDDELTLARKSKTLHRNFQGYSTKAGSDLYGLGMSSISHFGSYYAQNAKTLPEYYSAIGSGRFATHVGYAMSSDDLVRKFVIMRLMCDLVVEKKAVESRFDVRFDDYFASAVNGLRPLERDGLIEISRDGIAVTDEGRLFLRNIAMCFDTYRQNAEKPNLYSRTV